MSVSKSVVRLLGNDYQIESENSDELIQRIGFYVDKKFNEVAERNSRLSTNMIAVITSLNIAEETLKLQEENKELSSQLSATVDMLGEKEFDLKKLSEENLKLKEQLQNAKIECARLEAKAERKY
ncbi:MAG: cell division protein ZapA [Clostridia bacterium]|nr:cell division protein ZapA [Clostridia bacterium]